MHPNLLLIVFLIASAREVAGGGDSLSFVYAGCSAGSIPASSPYVYNLNSLLSSLANAAGFLPYSNFTSSFPSSPAYGFYQCRADLSVSDCDSCVSSAISQLSSKCPTAVAASIQLHGCLVRYGNDSFVGRSEKELLYSKCGGPAIGGDMPPMMETVFGMLNAGAGLYRVGRSGYVGGSAQCVGDQTAKQCGDCVAAAVDDLRSNCGGSASGEAYLGKCFAGFWSSTPYYRPPYYDKNTRASEIGKGIAIIVGIVAAVLLFLLFLNHIKRSQEEKELAGK